MNAYCKEYFSGEIADELVGMTDESVSSTAIGKLSQLPMRRFTRLEFAVVFEAGSASSTVDIDSLLQQLFLCGALANIVSGGRQEYIRFYHRRNHAELNTKGPFVLHNAMALSLGVHWS